MGAILKSVGCTYKNVVKTTVLLDDIKDFVAVNNIYKKFFSSHEPARAAYQVSALSGISLYLVTYMALTITMTSVTGYMLKTLSLIGTDLCRLMHIFLLHKLNSGCQYDRLFRDFLKTVLRGFLGYSYFYYIKYNRSNSVSEILLKLS